MSAIEKASENKLGWILMILAFIGLTALVISHFTDAAELLKTLRGAKPIWIAAGTVLHILYFVAYAVLYKIGFNTVEVKGKMLELLPLMMASIFVRAVVPSGGATAAALFVDDAVQRGESGPKATIGVVLVLLMDLLTLIPFILWGLVFLLRDDAFRWYDGLGIGIFLAYIGVMLGMLVLAYRESRAVTRFLTSIEHWVNRVGAKFRRPHWLADDWPQHTAEQFGQANHALVRQPKNLLFLMGWGIVLHAINLMGLWALVKAFGQSVPIGGLVATFGMGIIFFVIGVIPEGIAIVETVMTLVFTAVGISQGTAIAITMVFRGVNFWLPIAVGLFALGRIRRFGERSSRPKKQETPA